jgi:hypothetical protein
MALALAHRIASSLAQNVTIDNTAIVPGASIGVAWTDAAVGCDAIVMRSSRSPMKRCTNRNAPRAARCSLCGNRLRAPRIVRGWPFLKP